jgi:signal transduction histidine kinase
MLHVAVAVLASVIIGICAINSAGRIGKPFPGFFVWENLFVPAVGESWWTGVASGLRYHSWVLAVEGQEVGNAREFNALLKGHSADEPVEYRLQKDGRDYTITTRLMAMDFRAWVSVLGIYLFDALALLILGLVVLYMKPGNKGAEALFLFCVALSLYIAISTDLFGPYLFRVPYFFLVTIQPAGICYMLSHFPLARQRRPAEAWIIRLTVLGGLGIGAASNYAFHGNHTLLMALDRITHFLIAAFAAGGVLFFGWHFFKTRDPMARQRTKLVALGTAGAFVFPAVMLTLGYTRGVTFPLNFLTVFFVLFPISIGYAIAQHDLFHVDRVIKRALVYAVLSAFVFGIYTIAIGTFDYFFRNATAVASRMAEGALILALILLTNPSRARIQDLVDRLYDRRHYSYRDVVRSTSRAFTRILDFERLIRTVLSLIDETVQPEFVHLYTVDSKGAASLRGRLDHRPEPQPIAQVDLDTQPDPSLEPLTGALHDADFVTSAHDPGHGSPSGADASSALRALGGAVAIPMRLEGRLVGLIIIGRKRAGGHHTGDDLELLRTISDQLSIALENAHAYDTIDLLNQNLELKNVALLEANRELREAQAELVQKERLAAIGMLSGAVAHGIRSPLAGIRAAAQLALLDLEGHAAAPTITDVVSETDRLNDRLEALLDFSKPFQPDLRSMPLSDVAARAVRDMRPKAMERDVEIVLEEAPKLPQARIDPVLFEQAIAELISNAIDASPTRSEVVVRTGHGSEADGSVVWLEVQDAGPGLPGEDSDRLFDLFYTTRPAGTGFGLATVKKIAEGHGGKILAYNGQDGGACFRIVLPVQSRDAASA